MSQPDLIIHDEKDNVGVVVIETTKKGQDCSAWIMENDKTVKVPSSNDVPLGHKIALKDLFKKESVVNDLRSRRFPCVHNHPCSRIQSRSCTGGKVLLI